MEIKTIQSKYHTPLIQETEKTFFETYAELVEKYNTVSIVQIDNQNFIIKSLGRKDFKEIMLNQDLNIYLKEEAICELCTLYPENYDYENSDAGVASKMFDEILKISFLKKEQENDRKTLMNYFRSEMVELHNQISCMIAEAFPSLNYEEIENFDMAKTLKYLSRAEWILQNLRGFEILRDPFTGEEWETDSLQPSYDEDTTIRINERPEPKEEKTLDNTKMEPQKENKKFIAGETIEERIERLKKGEIKPDQLTLDKLNRLQQQFPEIDWTSKNSANDFKEDVSAIPVALRTGDQLYKVRE